MRDDLLPRDAMHKRGQSSHAVSVCHVFANSVNTSNRMRRLFPPTGSQTILVFAHRTLWRYSDGDPLNGGVECRWCRQKWRFSHSTSHRIDDLWSAIANNNCDRPPCSLPYRPPRISESLFITTSMDDHDFRTEFVYTQR